MTFARNLLILTALLTSIACVKRKIFRAEASARQNSEARETVLLRELGDRKRETANLTKQVGELNRTIGTQEEQIRNLQSETASKTQMLGESSSKLASQITQLEVRLRYLNDSLARREAILKRVLAAQNQRSEQLNALYASLSEAYETWFASGLTLLMLDDNLVLTFPDKDLFESNGLIVSSNGLSILTPLANFLVERPELDVEIHAHTDNSTPKDKAIKDSWDWSLARATTVARTLVREMNVNANQLTPVAKGEFYPVESNSTPEGRALNRRTQVVIKPILISIPRAE